jgi:hypothetical protein
VWTSVGDLVRYADAVRGGELLPRSSWQLMGHPQVKIEDSLSQAGTIWISAYGYGIYIGSIAGDPALFHTGDNPGFRSLLAWLPQADTTFAILANDESTDLEDIALRLVRAARQ